MNISCIVKVCMLPFRIFNKAAMDACKKRTEEEYIEMIKDKYNIEDRTKDIVFSVDPLTSKDFDDAFS